MKYKYKLFWSHLYAKYSWVYTEEEKQEQICSYKCIRCGKLDITKITSTLNHDKTIDVLRIYSTKNGKMCRNCIEYLEETDIKFSLGLEIS